MDVGELAERWGFTREYVSQIERGKRKLDKQEQVSRLADILNIPEERLARLCTFLGDEPSLLGKSVRNGKIRSETS
jgi:transcriptional regulator with XRE-family HTH domain